MQVVVGRFILQEKNSMRLAANCASMFMTPKNGMVDNRKEGCAMTEAKKHNPYSDIPEGEEPRPSSYRVIEQPQEPPAEEHVALEPPPPVAVVAEAEAAPQTPAIKTLLSRLRLPEVWIERIQRFTQNPTRVYAAAGVGLGILFGVVFAVVYWHMTHADGRYDLGPLTSGAAGLKGRLWIEWDRKLAYRLTIEPSDPDYTTGFAHAVARPPRPLSIQINLQDFQGFVLCTREIVLKYDARNAEALAPSTPDSQALKSDAFNLPADQPAQTIDFTKLDAQEAARERGQDIFQNQIGPDGQIMAINAHGEIPCSKSAYEKTTNWSFTPDFPSLAEQDQWLKRQQEMQFETTRPAPPTPAAPAARKKKAATQLLPFTIEGDDAIVDFDAAQGVIATRGRKTFFIDKAAGAAADSAWQDYPVSIHYRCDQSTNCILTHSGLGGLRVRMRR
jgi:hypothetical protein